MPSAAVCAHTHGSQSQIGQQHSQWLPRAVLPHSGLSPCVEGAVIPDRRERALGAVVHVPKWWSVFLLSFISSWPLVTTEDEAVAVSAHGGLRTKGGELGGGHRDLCYFF